MTAPQNDDPGRRPGKGTNGLALVAGALIALLAVLGFLALMSRRSGAQEYRPGDEARPAASIGRVASMTRAAQETVIVPAVAS